MSTNVGAVLDVSLLGHLIIIMNIFYGIYFGLLAIEVRLREVNFFLVFPPFMYLEKSEGTFASNGFLSSILSDDRVCGLDPSYDAQYPWGRYIRSCWIYKQFDRKVTYALKLSQNMNAWYQLVIIYAYDEIPHVENIMPKNMYHHI